MASDLKTISPAEIDKIVCGWTMDMGVALTEEQLNELVDRLSKLLEATQ